MPLFYFWLKIFESFNILWRMNHDLKLLRQKFICYRGGTSLSSVKITQFGKMKENRHWLALKHLLQTYFGSMENGLKTPTGGQVSRQAVKHYYSILNLDLFVIEFGLSISCLLGSDLCGVELITFSFFSQESWLWHFFRMTCTFCFVALALDSGVCKQRLLNFVWQLVFVSILLSLSHFSELDFNCLIFPNIMICFISTWRHNLRVLNNI